MFGWFKKRARNETDHEWVVTSFRERRATIEKAGPAEQLAFELTLAIYWKAFVAEHGSPARFAQLGRDEQMAYFNKMLVLQSSFFDRKDFEKAVPLEMLNLYLAAIINNHRAFEMEAASFLDERARRGHQLLPLQP